MKACCYLLLTCLLLVGCRRAPVQIQKKLAKDIEEEGPPQAAIIAASQATESSQFRDALQLFSRYIIKPDVAKDAQLSTPQRDFLRQKMFLSDDEIQEVETITFRPLDAHYLECCALLRDAARNLEKPNAAPLDVARHVHGWVCRQVLLAAPKETSWLPSDAVLHMGYGNARDRALLFLALLRQIKLSDDSHLEGCVLDSAHPLVGVLIPSDPDNLHLFDMVLGAPVPGPKGEGIATLAAVRKDAALLKAAGISQSDLDGSEYYMNCPLSAAAPRMKLLEGWLKEQERPVVLYMDVAEVHQAVAHAAQKPVRPGNAPPEIGAPGNSPTRIMRWFLPPDEGGREFSPKEPEFLESRTRRLRFDLQQRARPRLVANLRAMKLFDPTSAYVPKDAGDRLLTLALDMVQKFSVQPRDMMLRGQTSALLKRLNRVGRALEESELMDPAELQGEVAGFRLQAKDAYVAMLNRSPKAAEKMNALWNDAYLETLLEVNSELDPKKFLEPTKIGEKPNVRKHITHMVVAGCKDVVDQDVPYLWAISFHEECETLQMAADSLKAAGKDSGPAQQRAVESWRNAVNYWNKFIDRCTVSPSSVRERLAMMQRLVPNEMNMADYQYVALSVLPNLLRDWSRSCCARLNLARALQRQGQTEAARSVADNLARDLESVASDPDLQKDLDAYMNVLGKIFQNVPSLIVESRRAAAELSGGTLTNLRTLTEICRQHAGP